MSIFVEGRKANAADQDVVVDLSKNDSQQQKSVPGGKGFDGRWIYVSHCPLSIDDRTGNVLVPAELQPLLSGESNTYDESAMDQNSTRLIHLSFEPLILHICTASLPHAKPILALALDAGFRESGVQSLKCLDHAHTWPMVAIRSAGIGFSTVIGVVDSQGRERLIVGQEYLRLMLGICNDRFVENQRRTDRVRAGVRRLIAKQQELLLDREDRSNGSMWEDKDVRALRKREEGLKVREVLKRGGGERSVRQDVQEDDDLVGFGGELGS